MPEFIDAQGIEVGLGEVELEAPFEMQQTVLDLRFIQRVNCRSYLFERPILRHDIVL